MLLKRCVFRIRHKALGRESGAELKFYSGATRVDMLVKMVLIHIV